MYIPSEFFSPVSKTKLPAKSYILVHTLLLGHKFSDNIELGYKEAKSPTQTGSSKYKPHLGFNTIAPS